VVSMRSPLTVGVQPSARVDPQGIAQRRAPRRRTVWSVTAVHWFRRDLRLGDNPALLSAADAGDGSVVPLFVLDPALWNPAGDVRRAYLNASLRALDADMDGALHLRRGDPVEAVVAVARSAGASSVHVAADTGPYGRRRDAAVERALADAGIAMVRTGCAYAVPPGNVRTKQGTPYSVFTPFSRAWREHGWPDPAPTPAGVRWAEPRGRADDLYTDPDLGDLRLPTAGEKTALDRWAAFRDAGDEGLDGYAERRDRPDLAGTSVLSHHLKWGEIHPRTILADQGGRRGDGPTTYRSELAWREFYADVLWHHPASARAYYRDEYARMAYDSPDHLVDAWREGRTGYPFVDAGMRQLRTEGWMHNRVRMVVASFLVKDLHVEWQHGARHFMRWLRDADLASNSHGWQWAAGSGTDAAPYFRVFNPVSQGRRFDPDGTYVRRYVPELAHLDGATAHEPWTVDDGYAHGYPRRVVDHAEERAEALRRYQAMRG
jgi:deoxyribodipyrimidine photo-lyase